MVDAPQVLLTGVQAGESRPDGNDRRDHGLIGYITVTAPVKSEGSGDARPTGG
jgi:hypothetical protein